MTVIASTFDEFVVPPLILKNNSKPHPLILKNSSRPHPLILSLSKNAVAIYGGGARRVAPKTPAWLTKQLLCKVSTAY
jgi:hypothetical protein